MVKDNGNKKNLFVEKQKDFFCNKKKSPSYYISYKGITKER